MTTQEDFGFKEPEVEVSRITFGKALSNYRIEKKIDQKKFSALLGISPQSICDLEKGRRIPTPARAAKIARQLSEPEPYWIQLALQDALNREDLNYTVSVT